MSHKIWTSCRKFNVSPNQLFFLDCCRNSISTGKLVNVEAERLVAESCGHMNPDGTLTEKAIAMLKHLQTEIESKTKPKTENVLGADYLDKVKEYREYFPSKRLDHGEVARQSVKELTDKFIWFFKTYTDYDWDIVLDAAKYYCLIKEQERHAFMSTSSYFIKKTDPTSKTIVSKLADYCQLILDNPELLLNI